MDKCSILDSVLPDIEKIPTIRPLTGREISSTNREPDEESDEEPVLFPGHDDPVDLYAMNVHDDIVAYWDMVEGIDEEEAPDVVDASLEYDSGSDSDA